MYLFITILIFLAAILLVLIVLVQNSKGGGLASGFSASNQVMGVRKTTDFLEKATWTLAAVISVLSIVTCGFKPQEVTGQESIIKNEVETASKVDPNVVTPNFGEQSQAAGATQSAGAASQATDQTAGAAQQTSAPASTGAASTPAATK
ncbi:MAG: preprotein translocase subunit SecG [Bacteroidota bacterium]|nr:preprotein translocase subunit SecG [Bacteroidota bacterium]